MPPKSAVEPQTPIATDETSLAACMALIREQQKTLTQQSDRLKALETSYQKVKEDIDKIHRSRVASVRELDGSAPSTPTRARGMLSRASMSNFLPNGHGDEKPDSPQKKADEVFEMRFNAAIEPYAARFQEILNLIPRIESLEFRTQELQNVSQSRAEVINTQGKMLQRLSEEVKRTYLLTIEERKTSLSEFNEKISTRIAEVQNFANETKEVLERRIAKMEISTQDQIQAKISVTLGDYVNAAQYMEDRSNDIVTFQSKADKGLLDVLQAKVHSLEGIIGQLSSNGAVDGGVPDQYSFDQLNDVPPQDIARMQSRVLLGKSTLNHTAVIRPVASSPASYSPQYQLLNTIVDRLEDISCSLLSKVDQKEFEPYTRYTLQHKQSISELQQHLHDTKTLERELDRLQLLVSMKQDKIAATRIFDEKLDKRDFEHFSRRVDQALRSLPPMAVVKEGNLVHYPLAGSGVASSNIASPKFAPKRLSMADDDYMSLERHHGSFTSETEFQYLYSERESSPLPELCISNSFPSKSRPATRAKTPLPIASRPSSTATTQIVGSDGSMYQAHSDDEEDVVVRIERAVITKSTGTKGARVRGKSPQH